VPTTRPAQRRIGLLAGWVVVAVIAAVVTVKVTGGGGAPSTQGGATAVLTTAPNPTPTATTASTPTGSPTPTSLPTTSGTNGCAVGVVPAPCAGGGQGGWGAPTLDDEFNSSRLDTRIWASSCPEYGANLNGVGTSPSNVAVGGGNLVLTLSSPTVGSCVSSRPGEAGNAGFSFRYGYAEARIHFAGDGTNVYNWPAFWTDSEPWPQGGEVDIAEGLHGGLTADYHAGTKCDTCQADSSIFGESGAVPGYWSSGYHIFGVDREPGVNTYYWDGVSVYTVRTSDGGAPEWLVFNIGEGKYGGQVVTGAASQVSVGYVRVWVKK
jgi:beta-glucanase (GH16 family)